MAKRSINQYVAFLRAINVAGHACVEMSAVRAAFAAAGCRDVRTYIQSGNVLFGSPAQDPAAMLQKVRGKLRHLFDDEPDIMLRTAGQLEALVRQAPFQNVQGEPDIKLYVAFLAQKPRSKSKPPLVSSKEALEVVGMNGREVLVVSRRKSNGFFGFPNLFIEKELGVSATTRNWSTVTKIAALMRTEAGSWHWADPGIRFTPAPSRSLIVVISGSPCCGAVVCIGRLLA